MTYRPVHTEYRINFNVVLHPDKIKLEDPFIQLKESLENIYRPVIFI